MNRAIYLAILLITILFLSFHRLDHTYSEYQSIEDLRRDYQRPSALWPAPTLDSTAVFTELGAILSPPALTEKEQPIAALGKMLFYDPRLSSSNQISCSTCHIDTAHWADKQTLAVGHQGLVGTRNTPSIENAWIQRELFWDGRANSLQEQQMMSIENHVEMFQDIDELPAKIAAIMGYKKHFKKAYGNSTVTKDRILDAIALFQKTIVSNPTPFDAFMQGDYTQLTDQQVHGLHLFRTKARCINCHSGPYFTDLQYHNEGFTFYKRKREDLGRYNVTHKAADVGKMKTPGLRNVLHTGPWFHQGIFPNIESVIGMYNAGMNTPFRREEYKHDTLFPITSPLIKRLGLTKEEQRAIIAFLESLSSEPMLIEKPKLPK
ncbi:cytochrome-c peroxidase [Myroides marinus]|uniref:cytochrome-c peroxidase n=1 Tax=Myroides marinus TaxID=703342 RepID=UPI002579069D|nr:cytochrome c peroxidase [Myroides marinus]MDM1362401.1 cytochrome-c peroxidase [Myroides marinus]MDM1369722.1 cytochrome-c peroxidase [Myroides marinus]MDM1376734.1 cytochrome-c peroxidase [Myroides marinus]MDM1384087.1 cytochrome-c peroxidase [Myroides marinus]MDM1405464.1 cytochrome-c peroxidase [Myroides marinus]